MTLLDDDDDDGMQTVVVYDQRGDRLAEWSPGEEVLRRPHGLATTPHGELIVTDTGRSAVCVLSASDGHLLRQFGSKVGFSASTSYSLSSIID